MRSYVLIALFLLFSNMFLFPIELRAENNSIVETSDSNSPEPNKLLKRQLWIDCKSNKFAIGRSQIYINGELTADIDLSKFGKVWFEPNGDYERNLINKTCKGEKSSKQKDTPGDLVIFHKYKDGWGETNSCAYQKSKTIKKGDIIDVQLDRIDPTKKTVREWLKINCKTKQHSSGKIKQLDTGYTAVFGYNYWYDYNVATADPCTGKLIDLVCGVK